MNINKIVGYLSIWYKLIIAFLAVSFIPLVVVGGYGLNIFSTGLSTMADKHVEDEVFTIARLMDSFLTTVQHDLSNLSRNLPSLVEIPPLREAPHPGQEGKAEWVNQLRSYFYAFLTQHEGYRQISYFDETGWEKIRVEIKNGEVKFASSESLQFLGESEFFQDSIELNPGEIYICPLELKKEEPLIWFGTPVFDKDGLKRGILVADFSMTAFHHFAQKAHPPSKSLTILINNQGQYLYHPLKAGGRLSDDYPPKVVSKILSRQKGIIGEDGEIIGYAPVSDKLEEGEHWIVVHTLPKDAILSPVKELKTFFLGIIGVMLTGVFIVGFFAARHFTKPIEELRKGTASIAQGDLNHRLDIQTNDEIELLANDFNHMAQAISDLEGRLKMYASGLEEMVEERTMEIKREKQKLDNIVKGIGTALALVDREMRILWHNDIFEEWFGKIDISQGIKCYEMCRQFNSPCNECPAVKTFCGGGIEQIEQVMATRTGEKRVFQYTTGPIRDDGNVVQVLIMLQNITEKKQLEAQVIHQEKMAAFGLLAAGVAHEVGNPLTSLSSLVQYVERKKCDESVCQEETFSLMRFHIDRIANIVREMVDFARPPKYEWCLTQVNDVIQSAIGIAKYDPCDKEVEVKTLLDPEIPLITLVPDQLLQVCLNIILNAFDAMQPGGELTITSKQVEEKVEIAFEDNGPGMSKEVMKHVFEPFFTTKEAGKGTGLGLSVSYGIIKNFGGEILVESQIGRGTTFTVVLPLGGNRHGRIHTNS
ncbi:MAG: HAMP domain-containing protein [Deltaproteobacteria bacterium]|nr:HAMP domain-containing protein [Deltaproteobacteria bacterium]